MRAHSGRFGFFAALPMPDVNASLAEAAYALDTLQADGVELFANSRGVYLGEPASEPLFAELNRRRAVRETDTHPLVPGSSPYKSTKAHFWRIRLIGRITAGGQCGRWRSFWRTT